MRRFFEAVTDVASGSDVIRRRAYGVIETAAGRLRRIHFRPWPKVISLVEVQWLGQRRHGQQLADFCQLYFNQPLRHRNFLTLKYVISGLGTTLQTFRCAITVLDQIAQIKESDAILCEVTNDRISSRLLERWGWERHLLDSPRRHYIKRFYGDYSQVPDLSFIGRRFSRSGQKNRLSRELPERFRAESSSDILV